MTATGIASMPDRWLEDRIQRAVRSYHHRSEDIVRADLAATVAHALLQMRPPADAGDRAAGITEGLEMAVRTLLRLAGVDAPDNPPGDLR